MDDVKDTFWQTSLQEHLGNNGIADWGELARFQDAGIPRNDWGSASSCR